ncbi:outer membrane lipoprotein chaperone LolA [Propionivibrio dicarboxylicus]|uniref:Outer-membrane lipoprotein carrier protein n=1 Tax=Propionivibrio dicarboxylicus TaxID=83767 RepID=A0A1G8BUE3_9RHOO|nr:outer membrane lipoprotein chaperone LolA [Propionivibrio dicarboxylicus]SDH36825.1 outer membrane lipoprotein carrier protein [Propionivibrio dicarboxylicus]
MRKLWCVLALLLVSQGAAAGAIERLHQFLDSTRTLRAGFTQIVVAKNGKRPQQSSGVMIFVRPGKFRWQIEKPYSQLLVGDGEKIWIYDPDLRQVTVKKAGQALGGTPASLLAGESGGKATLERNFSLREAGEREGLEWVEALPKTQESGFEKLRLGFAGSELKAMELFDNFGQTTSLYFENLERNPSIAPSLLRFTPPSGVDVISE